MIEESQILNCGKFFRTHALKGELNVVCEGVSNEILDEGYPVIVDMDGIYVPFYVESFRPKGAYGCLISLEGVDSVEEAQKFVNKEFFMLKKDVAEFMDVEEDELVEADDYIGWRVNVEGYGYIGNIEDIDTSTPNWLLLVRPKDDSDIIYIPFNEEFIISINDVSDDPSENGITLSLPEGVIDLNKKE